MAENNKGKTLQQLADKAHSGLGGLASDADLALLFEDELAKQEVEQPVKTEEQPKETQPAPPSAEPAQTGEVEKGQADLLNLIPDKFKSENATESIAKMAKALSELEAEYTRKSQDLSQLQALVQELSRAKAAPQSVQQEPTNFQSEEQLDIDDSAFFEKPIEATSKVARLEARREAAKLIQQALAAYEQYSSRKMEIEKFRAAHPDFDNFRGEMLEVLREHPEWEQDITALPRIYEAAKQRAALKLQAVSPQITPDTLEKLKSEWMQEAIKKVHESILEEARKRRAASGMLGGTSTTVAQRVVEQPKEQPKSYEEQLFEDILASGPKKLEL